jgi:Cu/Ag efflux pump CusA
VAARYGIGPSSVGTVVQLVTTGLKLTDYRPAGADDAVDIRLRLPEDRRTLSTLDDLRIETSAGFGPDLEFRHPRAGRKRWNADRIDGVRTITGLPGSAEGIQADPLRQGIVAELEKADLEALGIRWKLAGEDEEQKAAGEFLSKAAAAAMFLIFVVLLAQFNLPFRRLVLSAVVMSTIGVFLGLLITGQPFGIVMTGIGVIALAGVVVNNNIVLIDTYDHLSSRGQRQARRHSRNLSRACKAGGAHRRDRHSGCAADRLWLQSRTDGARDHLWRAVDTMVDLAVERHRLRTGVLDHPDPGGDAIPLDDCHPLERQQGDRLVATHEGACRSWEQARSASSQGRSCRIASLCP